MTAELIKNLFRYNSWANGRILETLESVPEESYFRDLKSSHGGLHGTMNHMIFAQEVWLLRWTGQSIDPAYATVKRSNTFGALRREWDRIEAETASYLASTLSDGLLLETFDIRNSRGDTFIHSYGDSMVHLLNHSTYHRGQLAGMMRQLGISPPGTDFILFTRERR